MRKAVSVIVERPAEDYEEKTSRDTFGYPAMLVIDETSVFMAEEMQLSTYIGYDGTTREEHRRAVIIMRTAGGGMGLYSPMDAEGLDMYIRHMTVVRDQLLEFEKNKAGATN